MKKKELYWFFKSPMKFMKYKHHVKKIKNENKGNKNWDVESLDWYMKNKM